MGEGAPCFTLPAAASLHAAAHGPTTPAHELKVLHTSAQGHSPQCVGPSWRVPYLPTLCSLFDGNLTAAMYAFANHGAQVSRGKRAQHVCCSGLHFDAQAPLASVDALFLGAGTPALCRSGLAWANGWGLSTKPTCLGSSLPPQHPLHRLLAHAALP